MFGSLQPPRLLNTWNLSTYTFTPLDSFKQ